MNIGRMKAGTAQKLVLNMLSTATMVRLGRTLSGAMIGVQMNNRKLRERGVEILMRVAKASRASAQSALKRSGWNLLVALLMLRNNLSKAAAERRLADKIDLSALMRPVEGGS